MIYVGVFNFIIFFFGKKKIVYERKGRGGREISFKNKFSNKFSCVLIILEVIIVWKFYNFNGGYYKYSGKIVELIIR